MIPPIVFVKISFVIIALIMAIFGVTYVGLAYFNLFPRVRNDLYIIGSTLVAIATAFVILTLVLL
ncbi:MAG: hypothetical protein QXY87_11980 [Saccharolobus sp.]|uniref:Uncharacterized protein n=2 Tax=Saccharolobus shibatae TaxID=2286 RepID=A0A8F5BU34_9CREN|nr:hypothetical protein [Saccharolobus shibatae]MCH4815950.1 hypothetical protein [Saccharolobus shibatae]QXJ28022.1 hypothetical protein J5U23_00890 [Saccharolobus shibatae B12]QXJ31343.1 hypothetical protein J5U21_00993 [Saccharolobus shibatae]QXJ34363.1 hypothetical protein J5U22_00909 [Saccharolobus shibatae]